MFINKAMVLSSQKGVAVYMAIMIMMILLAMVLGLSSIFLNQTRMMRNIGYSVRALCAADTGIERALKDGTVPSPCSDCYLDLNGNGSQDTNDSTYGVTIFLGGEGDCPAGYGYCIKSVGAYKDIKRAVEINSGVMAGFSCGDTVDYEGHLYPTIEIAVDGGTQCWLQENLNVGTMINLAVNQANNGIVEKYCYSNNPANCTARGGLYQWNEAMQYSVVPGAQGICPPGWHIPTDNELYILESSFDDAGYTCNSARNDVWDCQKAGDKLKVAGFCQGRVPCATTGFNALLGGLREYDSSIWGWDTTTYFFTSEEADSTHCKGCRELRYDEMGINRESCPKTMGFAIRCIKD